MAQVFTAEEATEIILDDDDLDKPIMDGSDDDFSDFEWDEENFTANSTATELSSHATSSTADVTSGTEKHESINDTTTCTSTSLNICSNLASTFSFASSASSAIHQPIAFASLFLILHKQLALSPTACILQVTQTQFEIQHQHSQTHRKISQINGPQT